MRRAGSRRRPESRISGGELNRRLVAQRAVRPPGAGSGILNLAAGIIIAPIQLFILFRVGLLAWMAAQFVAILFYFFPLTFDFSRWYATHGLAAIVVVVALAVYGFRLSLAGRPLFSSSLDD
jgi:hypothetical protein